MSRVTVLARAIEGAPERLSEQARTVEAAVLALGAFTLPLVLQHPQLLVGTAVNLALALAALHLGSWKRIAPVVVLPAVAAVLGGALFESRVTLGLLCLVPGIWAGNALYVAVLRGQAGWGANYLVRLTTAAAGKTLVIGLVAVGLAGAGLLPWALVTVLVPLQVATALLGGLLAVPAGLLVERLAGR